MKKNNILKSAVAIVAFGTIMVSCKKVTSPEPIGDGGQTIVKLYQGLADTASGYSAGYKLLNIDLSSAPQTLEMVDVRRDAANSNDLNKTMNIVVKNDPGAVTTYNSALVPLPAGSYTVDAATPLVGSDYSVTLEPGNIARIIKITIPNAQALDLNNSYGMGFTISSVDANGKIAGLEKTIVVEIGLKNKWDGRYIVSTNSFVDLSNATLIGYASWKAELRTSGQYTDVAYLTDVVGSPALASTTWIGQYYHPIVNTGTNAGSVYGNFGMEFIFNESNRITGVNNPWGNPSPGPQFRNAQLDPAGVNTVNANRSFRVKYRMIQPLATPLPGNIRTIIDETWIYQGPR
jgi:Domain of unknown function (DUF1735)